MDANQQRDLTQYLNTLDQKSLNTAKANAKTALANGDNHNHSSWDWIKQVAKALGITTTYATVGGGTLFALKKIANHIVAH